MCSSDLKVVRQATDYDTPVLLAPNARARHFELTIWTIVPADFNGDASIASYRIAFLAEVEVVNFVIRIRGGREIRRWGKGILVQKWTVDLE